ncbi:hypothetical protein CEXT_434771 [Caerostris extrusa]|uniref:Uncharacterized protein n=1 Tax=Caerostris extrusa TaxID=172846 RepID=A0AAV4XRG1_CAEEX|nr:hypothetical protein CEXT_434771 [Caerostris extrusa]
MVYTFWHVTYRMFITVPSFLDRFLLRCSCSCQCLCTPRQHRVSAVSNQQDVSMGNYAYRYDIRDAATGSLNSKAEVGKGRCHRRRRPSCCCCRPGSGLWRIRRPCCCCRVAYGGYAALLLLPAVAARVAYGGALGHGAALGWGYGAGIMGAGLGKAIL